MKHFSKFITAIALAFMLCLPVVVFADDYGIESTVDAVNEGKVILPRNVAGGKTIPEIVGNIVAIGLGFLGVVFFLLVLYSGLRWMIARGNAEDVTKAKDTLEAAGIGLIIVLSAYAVSSFVLGGLTKGEAGGGGGGAPVANKLCTQQKIDCTVGCLNKFCATECGADAVDKLKDKNSACYKCVGIKINADGINTCRAGCPSC